MRWTLPLLLLAALVMLLGVAPPPALGRRGMVAADQVQCSEAAASVLERGGNAADAAVAAALACGVVQPSSSGLGGGGFAVLVEPDGDRAVLDFREVAPAAASREMFIQPGLPENASTKGGLAVAVPGEPAGLVELHRRWGRLPLASVAKPAIELARGGFVTGWHLAKALAGRPEGGLALSLGLFKQPPPREGDIIRNRDLASTLQAWARTGGRALTEGEIARRIAQAAQAEGGILSLEDLGRYRPKDRVPLVGRYRDWTVVTMPPPSSGGVVLLQALSVLEAFDLESYGHNSAEYLHLLAEVMQHAYADRARYMGDPDRVEVPVERLLSAHRISEIRRQILPGRTFPADHYGTPMEIGRDAGTQHISVVDADGFAVALTTTINTGFGSEVVVPGTGIVLNNEMDDFVARPGEPNAYGLVGSEANAVAPGARPLSSMTPTVLISADGQQRIVVGASGGPFIISSTLQAILNVVDFGMDPSEAVSAERAHHQWMPRLLMVDAGMSPDTLAQLRVRGHEVKEMEMFSSVELIHFADGKTLGAADPRKGGQAVGAR